MPLDPAAHVALAWREANRYWSVHDFENVACEALLALVRACERFEPERGLKPSSYLVPCIANAVKDEVRRQRKRQREVALYVVTAEGDEQERPDLPVVEPVAVQRVLDREVREAVERLPERERLILTKRFGLEDGEPATAKAVGEAVGLSHQGVAKVAARGVERLRQRLAKPPGGKGYASS